MLKTDLLGFGVACAAFRMEIDKTLTPSPWTTPMDYPNGLPKWTTLKWTTPRNDIPNEYLFDTQFMTIAAGTAAINLIYYMEESVLLETKPLVDSIRHFIRDPSGVFSICHL